ncbi:hypothetical protein HK098_002505 [Nowakowskiella sp. JEL0407]|nr:hypothetical protein HK098_002505 [Nowakowskiella sp. JEL0407]
MVQFKNQNYFEDLFFTPSISDRLRNKPNTETIRSSEKLDSVYLINIPSGETNPQSHSKQNSFICNQSFISFDSNYAQREKEAVLKAAETNKITNNQNTKSNVESRIFQSLLDYSGKSAGETTNNSIQFSEMVKSETNGLISFLSKERDKQMQFVKNLVNIFEDEKISCRKAEQEYNDSCAKVDLTQSNLSKLRNSNDPRRIDKLKRELNAEILDMNNIKNIYIVSLVKLNCVKNKIFKFDIPFALQLNPSSAVKEKNDIPDDFDFVSTGYWKDRGDLVVKEKSSTFIVNYLMQNKTTAAQLKSELSTYEEEINALNSELRRKPNEFAVNRDLLSRVSPQQFGSEVD